MIVWVGEEENTSNHWQEKREGYEAHRVEVSPGGALASLILELR